MLKSILKPLALASALALSAGAVGATTVTLAAQNGSNIFNDNGYRTGKLSSNSGTTYSGNVGAGGFDVKVTNGNLGIAHLASEFTAWCLDIAHTLALPARYEATTTPFSGAVLSSQQRGDILRLFNTGYDAASLGTGTAGSNYSAGFQLALWEIVNETSGAYDLASGSFRVKDFVAGAVTLANNLLGGLGNTPTGNWRIVYLQSLDTRSPFGVQDSQNLVTVAAVPLPAAMGLMILALGGLGVAARRRRG